MTNVSAQPTTSVFVLGASGSVGRQLVAQALARGLTVTAQSRTAGNLESINTAAHVVALDPTDTDALAKALVGQDAVLFALGDRSRQTTLFSDVTRALLPAMQKAGVKRLIAVTGVGAGETKGHGGFVYDHIIFPLFTKHIYADKNVQENLIRASGIDWVIVRPAPFSNKQPVGRLHELTHIAPDTKLRRIATSEVATFILDQLDSDNYLSKSVFIGHP